MPFISSPLICICNEMLSTSTFLTHLKLSQVFLMFIKGNKAEISAYRPISLLTFYSNTFEKIIYNRLLQHTKDCNCLGSIWIQKTTVQQNWLYLICGMLVLVATTTYDFIVGWRKLFRARCACWIPGGAFCVAGSWLAVGRNCGPEEGRRAFFFWYSRAAGWTPGGAL
jgi:hypothetical protein